MHQDTAARRLGEALTSAARAYGRRLSANESVALETVDTQSLLARLDLPCSLAAPAGPGAPCLPASQIEHALSRLRKESRRLARLARARHPSYDLNRHIAVRRLLQVLKPAAAPQAGPGAQDRPADHRRTGRTPPPFRPAERPT